MNQFMFRSFGEELSKYAGLGDLLQGFVDIFRGEKSKAKRRVEYHFSPKAGKERWGKFGKNISSKEFIKQLEKHPDSDEKMIRHAASLHDLSKGRVVGKMGSSVGKGKKYEIRKLSAGRYGCTCNDWKYVGSVKPFYECKHIKAFKEGKTKVASMSFKDKTKSFFDELSRISEEERRGKEKDYDHRTERPFSSLLTQEEEPTDYRPSPTEIPEEPEIILGHGN